MSNFNDWDSVLAEKGLRKAVRQYAIEQGEIKKGGKLPRHEDELVELFEEAISQDSENAFYFSGDGQEQVLSHYHYKFGGKYFEFDGDGMITGPLDYNGAEDMIDVFEGHVRENGLRDGYLVSIGGEFPDDFFTQRCLKLVKIGHELEINGNQYIRTKDGFELKK